VTKQDKLACGSEGTFPEMISGRKLAHWPAASLIVSLPSEFAADPA
jgi:hypothetical protein